MSLISRVRKQKAVYWPSSSLGPDLHGQPRVAEPVEVNVRWDDVSKQFMSADGSVRMSNAEVIVDRVMRPGEFLSRGTLADLINPADPKANGAFEIRRFDTNPNLRNTENLYTAYL